MTDRIRERRFDLLRGDRRIPGLLWTPVDADGPRPLVLIGHGAGGSKRESYVLALARSLVRKHGMAAAAIDGPVHGHRRPDGAGVPGLALLEFSAMWTSDPAMTDDMVGDWRVTLDELQHLPEVGAGPVGWWGLSMGTILGLPFVAAEPRVSAAVLGLMGLCGPTRERIEADAPRVACPVLFLQQWDDELFSREVVWALFDRIGTRDKRLHCHPGPHGAVPPEAVDASRAFLADRLCAAGPAAEPAATEAASRGARGGSAGGTG